MSQCSDASTNLKCLWTFWIGNRLTRLHAGTCKIIISLNLYESYKQCVNVNGWQLTYRSKYIVCSLHFVLTRNLWTRKKSKNKRFLNWKLTTDDSFNFDIDGAAKPWRWNSINKFADTNCVSTLESIEAEWFNNN